MANEALKAVAPVSVVILTIAKFGDIRPVTRDFCFPYCVGAVGFPASANSRSKAPRPPARLSSQLHQNVFWFPGIEHLVTPICLGRFHVPESASIFYRSQRLIMADTNVQINFDAPAVLRKWPSIKKERVSPSDGARPTSWRTGHWMNACGDSWRSR
jgi:hypothetical protein